MNNENYALWVVKTRIFQIKRNNFSVNGFNW